MAVPEQTPYIEHTGNGVTTSFALKFQCESKDHLIVLVDEIEPPIATWSLTGGNVVFTTAPAAGKKITAQRNTPFSRNVDYQSYNNSFRPPAVNKDFDWIWWKLQELGVADWILGARIDALKNYVDRKDDELKAYLMEEIRKQGVALDQLDEYYNYLMERLAQIAVDKGWDASFVVDGDKTQKQINDYIFSCTYYAEREGFVSGGTDNLAVWQNLQSRLNNGDIVVFKSGDFHFSAPMEIEKVIRITGQLRMRDNGTRLHFDGTSGVVRKIAGIILENVTIRGTQSNLTPDPETLTFGTVGLEERYDGTFNSGYTSINQVVINGFDTGRTTVKSGTATWAGAYRENYGLHINNCKIAMVALNGATHEKFYGGLISGNSQYGVYSDAPDMYNNLEFIGTTIEGNGNVDAVNSRNIYDSCNIYSGTNSKVTLIGSYNEHVFNVARNGGVINKIGSHEHINSYNFATDGTINLVSSSAAYDNKLRYTATLNSMIYQRTGCTTVQLADSNTVRISSNTSANNLVRFGGFKCQSAIKNKDIFRVKVSFDYDFKSGYTANPTLFILPTLFVNSVTSGRTDSMNAPAFIPVVMLQNSYNQRHSFEFYYKPRTDAALYLDEDGLLKDIQLSLQFLNAIGVNPNFTTDNLVCDISNLAISILADDQLQFEYEHLKIGTTAQRPLLTSSEAGFVYRDTDVLRNVVWGGARWDILFDDASGVSFPRVTTTDMQSATNAINNTNKYAGKLVYNNTTAKMYFSVGSGATSAWRPTDSSADITPA